MATSTLKQKLMVYYSTKIIITVLVINSPSYLNGHNVDWYDVMKERKGKARPGLGST